MSIVQTLRETHPYRLLLGGTLLAVVIVQMVVLAMLVQGQVHKAELRELQSRTAPAVVEPAAQVSGAAREAQAPARRGDGLVQVVYARHP